MRVRGRELGVEPSPTPGSSHTVYKTRPDSSFCYITRSNNCKPNQCLNFVKKMFFFSTSKILFGARAVNTCVINDARVHGLLVHGAWTFWTRTVWTGHETYQISYRNYENQRESLRMWRGLAAGGDCSVVISRPRSRDSSALEFIFQRSRSWSRHQKAKVLVLVSSNFLEGLELGLE